MIDEQGRVVAVEPGMARVETLRRSTCPVCLANAPRPHGMMQWLGIGCRRARSHLTVGSVLREDLLSLLIHSLPLLGLLAAAVVAEHLGLAEPWVIFSGLCGLLLSWLLVRWRACRVADDPLLQTVVLRASLAAGP